MLHSNNMTNHIETLKQLLDLKTEPIAMAFTTEVPALIPRIERAEPASCGYWKRAAEGNTFYTVAEDQSECPIGAHVHNVPVSEAKTQELSEALQQMASVSYLDLAEIPQIFRREQPFCFGIYGPARDCLFDPQLILLRVNAKQLMLLTEAARNVGFSAAATIGIRPTFSLVPQAEKQMADGSLGCAGNRVYTALPDHEAYYCIGSQAISKMLDALVTIVTANDIMQHVHVSHLIRRAQPS